MVNGALAKFNQDLGQARLADDSVNGYGACESLGFGAVCKVAASKAGAGSNAADETGI